MPIAATINAVIWAIEMCSPSTVHESSAPTNGAAAKTTWARAAPRSREPLDPQRDREPVAQRADGERSNDLTGVLLGGARQEQSEGEVDGTCCGSLGEGDLLWTELVDPGGGGVIDAPRCAGGDDEQACNLELGPGLPDEQDSGSRDQPGCRDEAPSKVLVEDDGCDGRRGDELEVEEQGHGRGGNVGEGRNEQSGSDGASEDDGQREARPAEAQTPNRMRTPAGSRRDR
jgi:hypothetical protein